MFVVQYYGSTVLPLPGEREREKVVLIGTTTRAPINLRTSSTVLLKKVLVI